MTNTNEESIFPNSERMRKWTKTAIEKIAKREDEILINGWHVEPILDSFVEDYKELLKQFDLDPSTYDVIFTDAETEISFLPPPKRVPIKEDFDPIVEGLVRVIAIMEADMEGRPRPTFFDPMKRAWDQMIQRMNMERGIYRFRIRQPFSVVMPPMDGILFDEDIDHPILERSPWDGDIPNSLELGTGWYMPRPSEPRWNLAQEISDATGVSIHRLNGTQSGQVTGSETSQEQYMDDMRAVQEWYREHPQRDTSIRMSNEVYNALRNTRQFDEFPEYAGAPLIKIDVEYKKRKRWYKRKETLRKKLPVMI